jgi:hypothetical protein
MEMRDMHAPDEQGFIPGVFNYCDRRCERCRFVRQCRVGAVDVDDVGEDGEEVADERPEDLRERMMKLMGIDPSDLEDDQDGDEEGFRMDYDPEDLEPDPEEERKQDLVRERMAAHPLSNMAWTYMEMVGDWIEPREAMLKAKGVSVHRKMELDINASLRTPDVLMLSEAFEEIFWFQHMLHVKCQRALHGKIEDPQWMKDLDMDPLQSDWNGTAKLAIEIARRSLDAWEMVVELMPEEADDILPMQELLRRIHAELLAEFPDAHRFIRAGFDAPLQPEE